MPLPSSVLKKLPGLPGDVGLAANRAPASIRGSLGPPATDSDKRLRVAFFPIVREQVV